MTKTVYAIIGCFSGEDYSTDDPVLFGIWDDYDEARVEFKNIIEDIQDDCSENCDYGFVNDADTYEHTDFDYDEHKVIRFVSVEMGQRQ